MEFTDLLRLAALVALFAAVSILTVGSLTLTNALLSLARSDPSPPKSDNVEYEVSREKLRSSIDNYVFKLFPLYAFTGVLLFIPVLLRMLADDLHLVQYQNGDIYFDAKWLAFLGKNYGIICLGTVVGYLIYVVWHVTKFKRIAVSMLLD